MKSIINNAFFRFREEALTFAPFTNNREGESFNYNLVDGITLRRQCLWKILYELERWYWPQISCNMSAKEFLSFDEYQSDLLFAELRELLKKIINEDVLNNKLPWFLTVVPEKLLPFNAGGNIDMVLTYYLLCQTYSTLFSLPRPALLDRLEACYAAGYWPCDIDPGVDEYNEVAARKEGRYIEDLSDPSWTISVIDPDIIAQYPAPRPDLGKPTPPSWWDPKTYKALDKHFARARESLTASGLLHYLIPDDQLDLYDPEDWGNEALWKLPLSKREFIAANEEWLSYDRVGKDPWLYVGRLLEGDEIITPRPGYVLDPLELPDEVRRENYLKAQQTPGMVAVIGDGDDIEQWFADIPAMMAATFWANLNSLKDLDD